MSFPARFLLLFLVALLFGALAVVAQDPPFGNAPARPGDPSNVPRDQIRLPNGKLQQDEILKADHEKSVDEAKQLLELAQSLQKDLQQTGSQNVLSLGDIHKTEEIEKLAKRIRARIRRY